MICGTGVSKLKNTRYQGTGLIRTPVSWNVGILWNVN